VTGISPTGDSSSGGQVLSLSCLFVGAASAQQQDRAHQRGGTYDTEADQQRGAPV
jgi:hypothetical protein